MRTLLFLVVLLMLPGIIEAGEPGKVRKRRQNVEFNRKNFRNDIVGLQKAITAIETGDRFSQLGEWKYVDALVYYLDAYDFNPNNAELNYKIGTAYLNTFNKQESMFYLENAAELDPEVAYDLEYKLGRAYQYNYLFEDAINSYDTYLSTLSKKEMKMEGDEVRKHIEEARNGIELLANPKDYLIVKAGNINTAYPDYCPIISHDGNALFFTSRRPNTTGGENDKVDYKYNEDIYMSFKTESGWSPGTNTGIMFNSKTHDATVGISPDGNTLLIYRGINGGDIYASANKNGTWSALEKLDRSINTSFKESSACYSNDGKGLYFTSDRPGGYGGLDIYYSEMKSNGEWGAARNLGSVINTPYDEEGVSFNTEGNILYFSSRGHKTMGGHDVFRSTLDQGEWSAPENMGAPLNTPDDDVFYSFAPDGSLAYFSSERLQGDGSQDIYMIEIFRPVYTLVLKGKLIDVETKTPVEKANVSILDENGEEIACFENLGIENENFNIELLGGSTYTIKAFAPGYSPTEDVVELPVNHEKDMTVDRTIEMSSLDFSSLALPIVYFDFDRTDLREKTIKDLDYVNSIMVKYPNSRLLIIGHTDIIGSRDYNMDLSMNRAVVVREYLINKGISPDRLKIEWYSFDRPASSNDNTTGRQLNRRTELRLVSR